MQIPSVPPIGPSLAKRARSMWRREGKGRTTLTARASHIIAGTRHARFMVVGEGRKLAMSPHGLRLHPQFRMMKLLRTWPWHRIPRSLAMAAFGVQTPPGRGPLGYPRETRSHG